MTTLPACFEISDDTIAAVGKIAAGLEDESRLAEATRHYEVIVAALNGSHDAQGNQDGLCVFEAVATLLGQITANLDDRSAAGFLTYVRTRAALFRPLFAAAGKGAEHVVDPDTPTSSPTKERAP